MDVLVFTNMYPFDDMPFYGSFVRDEVEALRRKGCRIDVLFVNGIKSKFNYLSCPLSFWNALRKKRYDIIHVHHSYCGFLATWQKKIPVVWTFHEGEITRDASIIARDARMKRLAYSPRFKRYVARKVDFVICVSEHLKAPLGREDAFVLPSGLDTSLFSPADRNEARRKLGLKEKGLYILFPSSRSRPEKRFDLAEASVNMLRVAGMEAEIIVLENVEHERVPLYMNASDLMLLTSSFEASPVTIREALACNVPVLSTDVGDARSILERVEGCEVVPPEPEAIAGAIENCINRYPRVDGREVIEEYSLANTADRIMDVYESIRKRKKEKRENAS